MTNPIYKLSVSVKLPEIATEGENFDINYVFENIGKNKFPGGTISIIMSWPSIGNNIFVNHPVDVDALSPGETHTSATLIERPLIAGYTIFTPALDKFVANDGNQIELYLKDGRTLSHNRPIESVRARSHEEISQKQSVQVAVIALILLVVFEVANLLISLFGN